MTHTSKIPTSKQRPSYPDHTAPLFAAAAEKIADVCNAKEATCHMNRIPDAVLLHALTDTKPVKQYLTVLGEKRANLEQLKLTIERDFQEALRLTKRSPQDTSPATKEDFLTLGCSNNMSYIMEKMSSPNEYDPAWYFHMLLVDKVSASVPHSDYVHGANLNDKAMRAALSSASRPSELVTRDNLQTLDI